GYDNTVTATLPHDLTGFWYVVVEADAGGAVFELDRTNNRRISTGTVQVLPEPPDLVVSAAGTVGQALAGSRVPLPRTPTNQGQGDPIVRSWVDNVYADTHAALTGSAVLLGSFPHFGLLNPGAFYLQTQLVTVPIGFLGDYNLFVVTDATDVVDEDPFNNTS